MMDPRLVLLNDTYDCFLQYLCCVLPHIAVLLLLMALLMGRMVLQGISCCYILIISLLWWLLFYTVLHIMYFCWYLVSLRTISVQIQ